MGHFSGADHEALAAAIAQPSAIDPLLAQFGRPDMSSEHGSIDFDRALEARLPRLRCHGFTKFVHENERRLVLHVEIPRELHGR